MSHFACGMRGQVERRYGRPEDIFRHACHRLLDSLDVDTRRDLNQGQALGLEPEDGTLAHVQDLLIIFSRLLGTERKMLDLRDKFFTLAFERKAKTHESCALGYIDKAAGADHAATETGDIHVALTIDLAGSHERGVQSPTVVKIKLASVRDNCGRIRRDAEVDTTGRHAAVDARFDRESNRVGQPCFGQRRADAVARNAGADVHDIAAVQISNCPAANRESCRELGLWQLGARRRRDKSLVEEDAVRLSMLPFRLGRLHNEIDKGAWNGDVPGRDRAAGDKLLRLADDETTGVMRRLGDRQSIEHHRLLVERAIAILIDRAGSKNTHVDLEAAIEDEFLAVNALDRQ